MQLTKTFSTILRGRANNRTLTFAEACELCPPAFSAGMLAVVVQPVRSHNSCGVEVGHFILRAYNGRGVESEVEVVEMESLNRSNR